MYNRHERMELLTEFENNTIQIYCDDSKKIHEILFYDLRYNLEYSLEDVLKTKIEIKDVSLESVDTYSKLHIYSSNGNEFIIFSFSLDFDLVAVKVETSLRNLFDEFIAASEDLIGIGCQFILNESKKTLDILNNYETDKLCFFKKNLDGSFYYRAKPFEEKISNDFDSAIIDFMNTWRSYSAYCIDMGYSHGGYNEERKFTIDILREKYAK